MSQAPLKNRDRERVHTKYTEGKAVKKEAETAVTGHKPKNATATRSRTRARTMPP